MTLPAVLAGALALGLMTALSPCALTANIAAISFISRGVGRPRRVVLAALLYTAGQAIVYVGLGTALLCAFRAATGGAESLREFASPTTRSLQHYGNLALGPVLMVIGMVLLGLIRLDVSISVAGKRLQDRVSAGGTAWALPLGMFLALAFCPTTAAMFLGALAISLEHGSTLPGPLAYGIGAAVPVIGFALVIAFAGQYLGKAFGAIAAIERWLRLSAGVIFTAGGVYYILTHIYGLHLLY